MGIWKSENAGSSRVLLTRDPSWCWSALCGSGNKNTTTTTTTNNDDDDNNDNNDKTGSCDMSERIVPLPC